MTKKSEHVKLSFKTFCDGTSMHGFTELYYAKNIFWTIFWIILLIAAIGLTTYQVIKSINQFMDQQTNTRTTTFDKNDMYPPVKICSQHWIYWVDWEKAFAMNFTKDAILYGMKYLTNVYTSDSFDELSAKIKFEGTMEMNKFTKIQQFYKSVAKRFPIVYSTVNLSMTFSEPTIFEAMYRGHFLCYSTPGEAIMYTVGNDGVEENEIFFFFQTQTYSTISKYVTYDEYNWYMTNFLTSSHGIYIDKENSQPKNMTSYALPYLIYVDGYSQSYIPIRDEDDYIQISVSVAINKWMKDSTYDCLVGQKYITTNRSHCDICETLYSDRACNCMNNLRLAVLNDSDYPNLLCQLEIFRIVTGDDGRKNVVSESRLANQTEMLFNESSCITNDTAKKLQTNCNKNCINPCEEWLYSFAYMVERFGTGPVKNYFIKNLSVIRIIYPSDFAMFMNVEVDRQTWEDFVANIGGLLGVWTGASLLSIVQLFYLCCCSRIDPKLSSLTKPKIDAIVPDIKKKKKQNRY